MSEKMRGEVPQEIPHIGKKIYSHGDLISSLERLGETRFTTDLIKMYLDFEFNELKAILAANETGGILSKTDCERLGVAPGLRDLSLWQIISDTFGHELRHLKRFYTEMDFKDKISEAEKETHERVQALLDLLQEFDEFDASGESRRNLDTASYVQKIKELYRRFPNPLLAEGQEQEITEEIRTTLEKLT